MIWFGNYLEAESKTPVSKLLLLLFTYPLNGCFQTFCYFKNESVKDFKLIRF